MSGQPKLDVEIQFIGGNIFATFDGGRTFTRMGSIAPYGHPPALTYNTAQKHWINGVARSRGEPPPFPDVDQDPAKWTADQAPSAPDLCPTCGASWACEHQAPETAGMDEVAPDAPSYRDQYGPRDNAGNAIATGPDFDNDLIDSQDAIDRMMRSWMRATRQLLQDPRGILGWSGIDAAARAADAANLKDLLYPHRSSARAAEMRKFLDAFYSTQTAALDRFWLDLFARAPKRRRFVPPTPAASPTFVQAIPPSLTEPPRPRTRGPPRQPNVRDECLHRNGAGIQQPGAAPRLHYSAPAATVAAAAGVDRRPLHLQHDPRIAPTAPTRDDDGRAPHSRTPGAGQRLQIRSGARRSWRPAAGALRDGSVPSHPGPRPSRLTPDRSFRHNHSRLGAAFNGRKTACQFEESPKPRASLAPARSGWASAQRTRAARETTRRASIISFARRTSSST